jgi:hypothetical protein
MARDGDNHPLICNSMIIGAVILRSMFCTRAGQPASQFWVCFTIKMPGYLALHQAARDDGQCTKPGGTKHPLRQHS